MESKNLKFDNCVVSEKEDALTGGVCWEIKDICLAIGGVEDLISSFIKLYYKKDFDLCIIYNDEVIMLIDCNVKDIPYIVNLVYHTDKATPLTLIGINELTQSYIVDMTFTMGIFTTGIYEFRDNKIIKSL